MQRPRLLQQACAHHRPVTCLSWIPVAAVVSVLEASGALPEASGGVSQVSGTKR